VARSIRARRDELLVAFRAGRGVPHWQQRHAVSPVPGAWPYGLEQLDLTRREVRAVDVPPLGPVARRLARLRAPGRHGTHGSALCWDESTALAMLAGVQARSYHSGVIWVTDQVTAHGDDAVTTSLRRALLRMDGLWVLSRPQADAVTAWLGPKAPPVHFLRFGVDADFYASAPLPSAPHVVSVGGDRDRDPRTLFAALELVHRRRPDARLTVQTSSTLTPPPGVDVVPRLTHVEVRDLIASSTVVAMATRPNLHASGMTVGLEAMSTGRPVVASATPGMDDYFTPDVADLVEPQDEAALAEAILARLDDVPGSVERGARARAAVESRHTTAIMCRSLAQIVAGSV
jgi:glycosyltransferase involved in cell wall biosynthesis